jgi:hypothetical protein
MRLISHRLIYVSMSVNSDIDEGQTDRCDGTMAIFEFVVSETHLKYKLQRYQFSTLFHRITVVCKESSSARHEQIRN